MTRFAHISDVHLGGWKQEPLQELNFKSFQKAIEICISEKIDFIIIAGDLFDTAYPSIEILKKTFAEFKKISNSGIPCFIVAGSHDYSVSGKTFLDVLEKAGFCMNLAKFEEKGNKEIILHPTLYKGISMYGYPGKKSGLEIQDLRKIKLNDTPGMFKILVLHTTIEEAKGTLPIDSISIDSLPKADYYALGHLHIDFKHRNLVYPGPIFPNNFQELRDLKQGSFCIINTESKNPYESLRKIELKIKDVVFLEIKIKNTLTATESIISEINKIDVKDKILLLKVKGEIEYGKKSDIKFQKIEDFAFSKGAYFVLRNVHDLKSKEEEFKVETGFEDESNIEEETIKIYSRQNPSDFNSLIPELMHALSIEKQEGEKSDIFTNRILEESRKILNF